MTFPQPHYDQATLDLMDKRRPAQGSPCPRHPDDPTAHLLLWKELYLGSPGDMHTVGTGIYNDGCVMSLALDTDQEPTWNSGAGR